MMYWNLFIIWSGGGVIYKNILDLIGNTPLVKLNNIVPEDCANFCKGGIF